MSERPEWYHSCTLSDEMCELWHGWDRIMDYMVAVELPKAMARELEIDVLRGSRRFHGVSDTTTKDEQ